MFRADLGSPRDRPFLRFWGFHPIPAKLGFVGFFSGSLVLWVGSLDYSLGSLDLWGVRWFLGKFVGFVPGSLILWGVRWIIVFARVQSVFLQEYFLLDFCCAIMLTASGLIDKVKVFFK